VIPYDIARCEGHGAGPSGHQLRVDCVNCLRRTAPRAEVQWFMAPPDEFPCPERMGPPEEQQ